MPKVFNTLLKKDIGKPIFCAICFLALSFVFNNCSFDKPSAPSWDVEVTIPLISKIYTMAEIAEDESSISLDSTGILNFQQEAELDEYEVGDQLTLDNKQDAFTISLGSFHIDSPGAEFTRIELREIYPQAADVNGQTVVVPPFSFETNKKMLQTYDSFSYVVIDSGTIFLRVKNNLVIPLGSPLTLEIWDVTTDTLVVSSSVNRQILPGETTTFLLDLQGKRVSNQLAVRMAGDSPGSGGQTVTIDATSRFRITAEFSDLKVSEAIAQIPQQIISDHDVMAIDDSLVITDGLIDTGTLDLSLGGDLPVDAWIVYEFPDLVNASGTTLIDSSFVEKNSTLDITIDLNNHSLRPQTADFQEQKIRFDWTMKTLDTGTEMVLAKSSDRVDAGVNLTDLVFSSLTGKIGHEEINIEQSDIEFDIPANADSVFFETAQMELILTSTINFPAKFDFEIVGQNQSGANSHLNAQGTLEPAPQPGSPRTTTVVFDQSNSNIKEFISILPSAIHFDGKILMGNETWEGTARREDYVSGMVRITAPFSLRLPAQIIDSDIDELKIDEDVKDDIIENLGNGSFYAEIVNHLPLGADVEIMFCQDDSTLYDDPILTIGPIRADAALVNGSGYVKTAKNSEITFSLTEDEMRTFLRSPLYSGIRVFIDGTNNEFIKVNGSDFLQIKSYSKIKVKINQD